MGGTSRSSTSVVEEIASQNSGVEILIITKDSSSPVLQSFASKNAKVAFQSSILDAIVKNWRFLKTADVVHIQGLWSTFPSLIGVFCSALTTAKIVISPRGMLEPWSLSQNGLRKKIALLTYQGILLRKSDCLHVTAASESEHAQNIIRHTNIEIIPNGLNVSKYQLASHETQDSKRTILFLSRIHPKKGIELLFDAWEELKFLWPEWQVHIVGDGAEDYIAHLKTEIQTRSLDSIDICDPLYDEEKYSKFASSDLFVLPTYSENFGIVVAEALASGLPVITTTGTPWTEIEPAGCGHCIKPESDAFVEAIVHWTSQTPAQRKASGLKGAALIQNKYSLASVGESFMRLYASLSDVN